MSEIQPALTGEEWARLDVARDVGTNFHREADGTVFCDGEVRPPHTHALAALALHGQEYGFTWEDVDVLRAVAETERLEGALPQSEVRADMMDELAARITALLRPRASQ